MSRAAAKHFIARGSGGKIINIASMLSFRGDPRAVVYRIQSAVMGVTRLLANEWAKHNINVNAIAPGIWRPTTPSSCAPTSSVAAKSSIAFPPGAGATGRSDGASRVPCLLSLRLHQWLHGGGGRRLAGALTVRDGWGLWYRSGLLSNYCPYAKVRIVHTPEHRYNVTALYKQGY